MTRSKKKLAFINIPDASRDDLEELITQLDEVFATDKLDLGYRLVFIVGKKWTTLNADEARELLTKIKQQTENVK